MHEMDIATSIADIARDSIPNYVKGARIRRINLKVGKLSAIVADSLNFCFEMVVADTPLEGAELVIEEVPVVARCKKCQTQWTVIDPVFICEKCQSGKVNILSGRELEVSTIEIEEEA